jgi:small subunit ribosomal protein S7
MVMIVPLKKKISSKKNLSITKKSRPRSGKKVTNIYIGGSKKYKRSDFFSPFLVKYSKFIRKSRHLQFLPFFYTTRLRNLNSAVSQFLFSREILGRSFIFPSERKFRKKGKTFQGIFASISKPAYSAKSFYEEKEPAPLLSREQQKLSWESLLKSSRTDFLSMPNLPIPRHPSPPTPAVDESEKADPKKVKKKDLSIDSFDYLSSAFVSTLCRRGLKLKAERIMEDTLRNLGESVKTRFRKFQFISTPAINFVIRFFFLNAIENVKPLLSLKKQVVAGVIRSSPIVTSEQKRLLVAIRWIVAAAKARSEIPFSKALSAELMDAFFSKGRAVSKRAELHSVVISSRAFLRLKSEKGAWFSKEKFTISGFRNGLRLILRQRLRHKFKQVLSRVYASKPVWKFVRFGNRSYKRLVFVKPSTKQLIVRLKGFLSQFNKMTFYQKLKFLLGFDRFVYIYRSKFVGPRSGFFKESIITISRIFNPIPTSKRSFTDAALQDERDAALQDEHSNEIFFSESSDIYRRFPFLVNSFPVPAPRRPLFRTRPRPNSIFFNSIFNRHWFRPSRVTVMYRRERDSRYSFSRPRKFANNRPSSFFKPPLPPVGKKVVEKIGSFKNKVQVSSNYSKPPFLKR